MKYLLILGLLFCIGCKKEKTEIVNDSPKTTFVKTKIKPTKIDSLATKEEVQTFVQKLDYPFVRFREHNDSIIIHKPLGKFELKKIKDFDRSHRNDIDSLTKIIADSLKTTESFYKADIDNNGFSDLVIIGDDKGCSGGSLEPNSTRSCDYSVYALMNFGNDSINPVDLMRRGSVGDAVVPKIKDIKGRTVLMIFEPPQYSWRDKKKISDLKKVELAYKNGTFVEYNENPKKYSIEKIEYETEPCYGSCPIFELTITNDRTALLNAIEFNSLEPNLWEYEISRELKGKFKANIDKESYQEIIDLLNYLDFPSLEKNYWVSATDNPGSKLTITYDQGKTKVISDYGKTGTLGLIKIYDMIANLRTSQEWK
jgi:hypothetical protein